jgi:CrcB protein
MSGPSALAPDVLRDVAVGGAIGATVRTGILVAAFSAVTLEFAAVIGVNLLGAHLLARLIARAGHDERWRRRLPLLGTGLLGSMTTFSGLAVPLAVAAASGRWAAVLVAAAASLVGGVVVVRSVLRGPGR